jgi:DNA (cytosine-5)-methyltransferase 1
MRGNIKFLDLFAGAGGLSEGFIRTGYKPVAHVEYDEAACYTLKTRAAYHKLKEESRNEIYNSYLYRKISRKKLYESIPRNLLNSIIHAEIGEATLANIFNQIDSMLGKRKLDLIIGGPPCQAYSLVGRSRDKNRMKGDKRNYLFIYYAEFLKKYQPEYFVFENVLGLLSAKDVKGASYFEQMRFLFKNVGYEVEYKVLNADEHGVLQHRKRIILVGKRGKKTGFYPLPDKCTHGVSVSEIFKGLPSLNANEGAITPCRKNRIQSKWLIEAGIRNDDAPITFHQARGNSEQDLEIYRIAALLWSNHKRRLNYNDLPERLKTHKQREAFTDRFKVVAADQPYCHTVVAHIAKDGHYYIHPDVSQNRSITPREAARIQTFPDDYFFESISERTGRTAAFRQIGNAVPVLLAQKIAEKLLENF